MPTVVASPVLLAEQAAASVAGESDPLPRFLVRPLAHPLLAGVRVRVRLRVRVAFVLGGDRVVGRRDWPPRAFGALQVVAFLADAFGEDERGGAAVTRPVHLANRRGRAGGVEGVVGGSATFRAGQRGRRGGLRRGGVGLLLRTPYAVLAVGVTAAGALPSGAEASAADVTILLYGDASKGLEAVVGVGMLV